MKVRNDKGLCTLSVSAQLSKQLEHTLVLDYHLGNYNVAYIRRSVNLILAANVLVSKLHNLSVNCIGSVYGPSSYI